MSKIGPILPNKTSTTAAERGAAIVLLDQILQTFLVGIASLVFVGILVYLPRAAVNIPATIVSFVILAVVVALMLYRNVRYEIRASLLLLELFLLSFMLFYLTGFGVITIPVVFAMFYFAGFFLSWKGLGAILALWAAAVTVYALLSPDPLSVLQFTAPMLETSGEWFVTISCLAISSGSIIGSQVALASNFRRSLEREQNTAAELSHTQHSIEKQLDERTLYYQRRLLQARVAAEISGSIISIHDPQQLLQTVVDLMQDRFQMYYIGVFVMDDDQKFAVLRAGTGEAGQKMIAARHSLAVGSSSMIGWATLNRQARIALDTGAEAIRFNNPYLPRTRSELALPILSKNEVLGAMSIQSTQPNAFDNDDIAILQGIADSLATALENARLYQQTQEALSEISAITSEFVSTSWTAAAREHGGLKYDYENPNTTSAGEAGAVHEFPILLRDQVIGYLSLESDIQELTPEETAFAEAVTQQTAIALENARLLEETQRHAREEQKLNELGEQFSQARTIDEILKSAVMGLGDLPSVSEVSIHLVAPEIEAQGSGNGNGHNGNGHHRNEAR